MTGKNRPEGQFYIGDVQVDADNNSINLHGQWVHVEPKAMHVLWVLALQAGQTVPRDSLFNKVWGERVVVEEALTRTISQLRKALNDSQARQVIQTVPKRGYRLTSNVQWQQHLPQQAESQPEPTSRPQQPESRMSVIIATALIVIMVIIVPLWWFGADEPKYDTSPTPSDSVANQPSVAVTAFTNGSGKKEGDYLAAELSEQLHQGLSGQSRLSLAPYQPEQNVEQKSKQVRFVITGRVERLTSSGADLVLSIYDSQVDKVVRTMPVNSDELKPGAITPALLKPVFEQLGINTEEPSSEQGDSGQVDVKAYQYYLRGNYWWMNGSTSEWFARAEKAFLKALEIEPDFASARGSLAYIYARYQFHDIYMPEAMAITKAEQAIEQALDLNPRQIDALNARAIIATQRQNFKRAEQALEAVFEVEPSNSQALYLYSELEIARNQPEKALAYALKAQQADPLSPWVNINLAIVYGVIGQYDSAYQALEDAISIDPDYVWGYVWKARILHQEGKLADAVKVLESAMELDPGSAANSAYLGLIYLDLGLSGEAQYWFEHTAALYGDSVDARFWKNFVRLVYQRKDAALRFKLLTQLISLKSGTYNLMPVLLQTAEELRRSAPALITAEARKIKASDRLVNIQNVEQALGLLSLSAPGDQRLINKLVQFEQALPQWSASQAMGARRLLATGQPREAVNALMQTANDGWLVHHWLRLRHPLWEQYSSVPGFDTLRRTIKQKQQTQQALLERDF
ncbi:Transcriptional activator CadC [Saliniradius amylolyticus]|uniref:Transcriptional activator CadC n=1 Tax=Saliniradius amylolyticus TaxID=2183582 RepID=A0A2S2E2W1_9ALTE|nr:tetratricopeptide repeat protein [Saliniradius amylolyticus]AWL11996.1 Transcriptional activator CadC [Saliniradius amylolyticus]